MSPRLPVLTDAPAPSPAAERPVVEKGCPLTDPFGRTIDYLRISVTDRCNLRCVYCMPEDGIDWIPHAEILSYEEIARVVRVLAESGLRRVRLTGGEPTVRRDLVELVRQIAATPGIEDLALTTNGLKLRTLARPLVDAGLDRFNVSLDTLDPARFAALTRGGDVAKVLDGIEAVLALGLDAPLKVNCVVVGGANDGDVVALTRHFLDRDVVVRFIEYMPFTDLDGWTHGAYVPLARVRDELVRELGIEPGARVRGSGPAEYWSVPGHAARVGFIHPVSEHFCAACNRVRLTATGELRPCLGHAGAVSLAPVLRGGGDDDALRGRIADALAAKPFKHDFAENPAETKGVMTAIGG
ncbi:MAG TPA: GTP 3',8-cyclase MoaA [bacterium]|nr:GTP 3',8-cyclase MoaA [bacterium]